MRPELLPAELRTTRGPVVLSRATTEDVGAIIGLLADDAISATRGDSAYREDRPAYDLAFAAIDADPRQLLVVARDGRSIVGTMQLTAIPGMSRRGSTRLQVEAVRVRADRRRGGLGSAMLRWTVEVAAPDSGAALVQLTSDGARQDAHRFYARLGFTASHVGFKRSVRPAG